MLDYYKILEVSESSSIEEIKRNYRKLALKWHPDKNKGKDEQFKLINQAYQNLSDPNKKRAYDTQRKFGNSGFKTYTFTGFDFGGIPVNNDFLFHIYKDLSNRRSQNMQPDIIELKIFISLKESIEGATKIIYITYRNHIKNIDETEIYNLEIKKGQENGGIIYIRDKGHISKNNIRGNVKCIIVYSDDAKFKSQPNSYDLHCHMNISFKDSILIPNIIIPTPTGEKLTIKPTTEIANKTITKIHENGLYNPHTNKRGDLVVHFHVEMPTFTVPQKKLIEEFF